MRVGQDAVPVFSRSREFPQIYPKPGWVEHNPEELFASQLSVMKEVIAGASVHPSEIAAVGITNQRETVVLWDRKTGKSVHNAIVWQCRRTSSICADLYDRGQDTLIREKTGLIVDAYFSGTKIKWILDANPRLREQALRGELLAGTIDSWLIWKLSGGKCHITDATNAARTMLYNIHTLEWDQELLDILDIPRAILPEVKDSSCIYCNTDEAVCGFSVPIAAAIGDQQSALFGQGCFSKGDAKNTYGTGCFMLMNTGDTPVVSENRLLTTVALGINGAVQYALEGSIFMGGAIVKWLRDEMELISTAHECDLLAETVPDANGVYLVPAFTGLGTPWWDMYARGIIIGLTRGVKKAHICRAALEGIAFQIKEVIDCMTADSGHKLNCLNVDGGASVSDVMLQFQADILGSEVCRPKNTETTALGAAFLAGLATGFWKDKGEILECRQTDRKFVPLMPGKRRTALYSGWQKAVGRALGWAEP